MARCKYSVHDKEEFFLSNREKCSLLGDVNRDKKTIVSDKHYNDFCKNDLWAQKCPYYKK